MRVTVGIASLLLASAALAPSAIASPVVGSTELPSKVAEYSTSTANSYESFFSYRQRQYSNMPRFEAKSHLDGSVTVTLKNGTFTLRDGSPVILNKAGKVVETLPKVLVDGNGQRFSAVYSITSDHSLTIRQDKPRGSYRRGGWKGYGKCIAKNAAGGFVGGAAAGCLGGWLAPAPAACGGGAATGALTGGVGATVGSLFWCW
ncbi:hypothetical protein ACUH9X_08020 [Dermabacteraceae bacterium P13147]